MLTEEMDVEIQINSRDMIISISRFFMVYVEGYAAELDHQVPKL